MKGTKVNIFPKGGTCEVYREFLSSQPPRLWKHGRKEVEEMSIKLCFSSEKMTFEVIVNF